VTLSPGEQTDSYLIFYFPPFAYLIFISPHFNHHFYLLLFHGMFISSLHNIKSKNFKKINKKNFGKRLKELAFINMVQQSTFCGKASEDANVHLQHFMEICSTFTIRGVTQDAVRLCFFPFSLLGKVKQWFHSNKEVVSTWEKCSNAFLTKFFPLPKTNVIQNKISGF
jgi:hypothetical protein